jgi:phage terminase small subunit
LKSEIEAARRLPESTNKSPVLQELKAERTPEAAMETVRQSIAKVLEARFGPDARRLEGELKAVEEDRLDDVLKLAAKCRSLASFRKKLSV